jgi:hypothetical protein
MGFPLPDSPAYRAPLSPGFQPPTSGKAMGSLLSGILFLFLPASIASSILGHLIPRRNSWECRSPQGP